MNKRSIFAIALGFFLIASATLAGATELRMSWWGGNARHKATNEGVKAFEAANPDIQVKTEYTGWKGHLERLTTQIGGNTEPDVMQTNWNWMPVFSARGTGFADLRDYSDVLDLSTFDESALAMGTNKGKLNGIPIAMTARVFYYNKELWAKAGLDLPKTWDDLMAAGPVFKQKLGDRYYPIVLEWRDVMAMNRAYFVQKYNIPMIDEENKKFKYSKAQMLEFFQIYADMVKNHVCPSSKYIASFGRANLNEHKPWINGEWGGLYMWNSAINKYNNNLKPPMKLTLAPHPMLPGSNDSGLFFKPAMFFSIKKDTSKGREGAKLINFILNEPAGVMAMGTARGVPLSSTAREVLLKNGILKKSDLAVQGLEQINSLPKRIQTSPHFTNPKIVTLFREAIEWIDFGEKTVEQTANEFTKKGERILRRAIK